MSDIATAEDIIDDLKYRMDPDAFKKFYDSLHKMEQENGVREDG